MVMSAACAPPPPYFHIARDDANFYRLVYFWPAYLRWLVERHNLVVIRWNRRKCVDWPVPIWTQYRQSMADLVDSRPNSAASTRTNAPNNFPAVANADPNSSMPRAHDCQQLDMESHLRWQTKTRKKWASGQGPANIDSDEWEKFLCALVWCTSINQQPT